MLQLQQALEANPDLTAVCYVMRPTLKKEGGSRRQITSGGRIENVFQGRSRNYPGDRYLEGENEIVVQLHSIKMMTDEVVRAQNVPVLALHVPPQIARDWLAEVPD